MINFMRNDWITNRVHSIGKNKKELAAALGLPHTRISEIISGKRQLNINELSRFAVFMKMPLSEVLLKFTTRKEIENSNIISLNPARVVGWVQAGNWTEAAPYPDDDMEQFYLPEIEKYHGVYGLDVKGDSMDRDYPPGTILVCVPLHNYTTGIVSGDHIIVRATCADGMIETTVKEYFRDDDATEWLIPKSFNPTHEKYPVPNGGAIDLLIKKKNIINIEMHAIVIASYKSRHQQ